MHKLPNNMLEEEELSFAVIVMVQFPVGKGIETYPDCSKVAANTLFIFTTIFWFASKSPQLSP